MAPGALKFASGMIDSSINEDYNAAILICRGDALPLKDGKANLLLEFQLLEY
jgi:hypothetical protein